MTRNAAPSTRNTARQPTSSPSTPPSTWPLMMPRMVPVRNRASAVWRRS